MIYNEYLSKSKIKTYKQCPHKFYNIYIKKHEFKISSFALERGKELHDIFDDLINEKINEEIIPEKYKSIIDNFNNFNKLFKEQPLFTERMLEDSKYEIHGIVDRLDKINDEVILIDYKSGNINDIEEYRFELALYTYLIESNYDLKVNLWGIYFMDFGKFIYEKTDEKEIEKALEVVDKVRENIEEDKFYKIPNKFCNWCELKINGYCEGGE